MMEPTRILATVLCVAWLAAALCAQESADEEKRRRIGEGTPPSPSRETPAPRERDPGLGKDGGRSPRFGDGSFGKPAPPKTFEELSGSPEGDSPADGFRALSGSNDREPRGLEAFSRLGQRDQGEARGTRARTAPSAPPEPVGPLTQRATPVTPPPAPRGLAPVLGATGRRLHLAWLEDEGAAGGAVRIADRSAGEWQKTQTVHSGEDVALDPASMPGFCLSGGGLLTVVWSQVAEEGLDLAISSRMVRSRSEDWTDHGSSEHEGGDRHVMACCFQDPVTTRLGFVWLDERAPEDGAAAKAMLLANRIDGDEGPGEDMMLDWAVTPGSPPAVASALPGLLVFYRDNEKAGRSDIAMVRADRDGWDTPLVAVPDAWLEGTCAGEGPAAAAAGTTIALAWYAEPDVLPYAPAAEGDESESGEEDGAGDPQVVEELDAPVGRVLAALSVDHEVSFGEPIEIETEGALGRVAVAAREGVIGVSWVARAPEGQVLRYREIRAGGFLGPVIDVSSPGVEILGRPQMCSVGGEFFIAWAEEESGIRLASVAAWK